MNPPAHAGGTDHITAIEARTEPLIKNKNAPKLFRFRRVYAGVTGPIKNEIPRDTSKVSSYPTLI